MTLAGAGLTATLKSTPASAELVPAEEVVFLEERVTSVRRPITADGRMTNTLPLPLLVLMPTLNPPTHKPGPWPSPVQSIAPVVVLRVQFWWHCCPPSMLPPACRTQWVVAPPGLSVLP